MVIKTNAPPENGFVYNNACRGAPLGYPEYRSKVPDVYLDTRFIQCPIRTTGEVCPIAKEKTKEGKKARMQK